MLVLGIQGGIVWNDRDITGAFGPATGVKLFVADQTFVNIGYRTSVAARVKHPPRHFKQPALIYPGRGRRDFESAVHGQKGGHQSQELPLTAICFLNARVADPSSLVKVNSTKSFSGQCTNTDRRTAVGCKYDLISAVQNIHRLRLYCPLSVRIHPLTAKLSAKKVKRQT